MQNLYENRNRNSKGKCWKSNNTRRSLNELRAAIEKVGELLK